MLKYYKIFIIFILIPLAGCSKSIISEVSRFHNLPTANAETIEVVSLDPNRQNSLEFSQYAALVGQHLGKIGYQPPQNTPSQLIAVIDYHMQPAGSAIDSGPRSSVGIGVGSGGRRSSVGIGLSIPIGENDPPQAYMRILTLEIIQRSDGVKLYEGQAASRGPEALPVIMPYLVNAIFQDFPGNSGSSNKVKAQP